MPAPLSPDLRRRLIRAVEAGSSAREAARRFEVSASAAIKLVRRVRETGSAAPARVGGHRRPLLAGHEALLRQLATAKPVLTLAEIKVALAARGIEAGHLTTVWHALRRLGLTHKKSRSGPRSRTARTSRAVAGAGAGGNSTWTRTASCSSTKAQRRPR